LCHIVIPIRLRSMAFPYTTLFRAPLAQRREALGHIPTEPTHPHVIISQESERLPPPSGSPTSAPDEVHRFSPEVENTRHLVSGNAQLLRDGQRTVVVRIVRRSEEHTSELQSRENLVCRLLLDI